MDNGLSTMMVVEQKYLTREQTIVATLGTIIKERKMVMTLM
jgi:hypothetical protein